MQSDQLTHNFCHTACIGNGKTSAGSFFLALSSASDTRITFPMYLYLHLYSDSLPSDNHPETHRSQ
jgi:hypothetical protein